MAAQPGVTTQDVATEIAKALAAQPGGITADEMASAIQSALAGRPGLTEEQVAMAVQTALEEQQAQIESAVQMAVAMAIPTAAPMMDDMMDDMVNPGTVTVMSSTFGGERFSQRGSSPTDYERQFHGYLIDSDVVDGRMIIVPGLARRWELSSDGRITRYTLREGA